MSSSAESDKTEPLGETGGTDTWTEAAGSDLKGVCVLSAFVYVRVCHAINTLRRHLGRAALE